MRPFTRRGLASFAVASVLIFAPLASTAAFADDEPTIETPVVETPAVETPAVEAPSEEPPAEEAPVAAEAPAAEAPAEEQAAAPVDESSDAPTDSLRSFAPMSIAPAYDCDYSSSSYWYYYPLYPFCVDEASDGASATAYWEPLTTGNNYYFEIYDTTADWTEVLSGYGFQSPVDFSTTPGHQYELLLYIYDGNIGNYYVGQLYYTAATLPPEAPTALTATRNLNANAIDLSWDASVESTYNPVVSYTVDVTPSSSGVTSSSSATSTAFTATGLVVGEEYTFTVTAVGQNGEHSTSTSTTATLEAIAPTAATSVVLTRTDETLSAAWTAPAYDGGIAPVEYWIDIYADGDYLNSYSQTGTSITFDETAEFSVMYTVYVTAYTDAGDAPYATSNLVTRADSVPGTPTAYTDPYGYKDARVHVSWDLAAATGSEVHTLSITLYDATGAVFAHKLTSLAGNRTSDDFTELPNDTAFTVTIAAINDAGTSAESAPVAVTTLGLIPPSPTADDLTPANNYNDVTVSLTGTTLTAHINGLDAGTWVYGTAFSTPTGLGWTRVDAAGTATWSIAGANLPAGAHTLAVQNTFGASLGSASFAIAAAAPAALAHAGTDSSGSITLALAMLALGVLVTATRLRRRARA